MCKDLPVDARIQTEFVTQDDFGHAHFKCIIHVGVCGLLYPNAETKPEQSPKRERKTVFKKNETSLRCSWCVSITMTNL